MIIQTLIVLSGALAVLLTQSSRLSVRRWAPWVGLFGQPFWLAATFSWATWGMFVCSLLYTAIWAYGAWKHWPRGHS